MKKSYWKAQALEAEDLAERAERDARSLRRKVEQLTRELEDKRKHWAPIKMKHPYVPVDGKCTYCDDPAEDERHAKAAESEEAA